MDYREFKLYVERICSINKIEFICDKDFDLSHNDCIGVFDPDSFDVPVLAYREDANAFGTLLHEFSHVIQYLENSFVWQMYNETPTSWYKLYREQAENLLFSWLDDLNFNPDPSHLTRYTLITTSLEVDCEMQAVKLIEKLNLNIDKKEYIKKANSLLYCYPYALHERKWFSGDVNPYDDENVWKEMPDNFHTFSYFKPLPKKIKTILNRCMV